MQTRRDIMTHQGEETRNRKCLVAVPKNIPIHRLPVKQIAQEAHDTVDRDHEQDPDDMPLLPRFEIVRRMLEHQGQRHYDGDKAEDGGEEEADVVEGDGAEDGVFVDVGFLQRRVADGPGVRFGHRVCGGCAQLAR